MDVPSKIAQCSCCGISDVCRLFNAITCSIPRIVCIARGAAAGNLRVRGRRRRNRCKETPLGCPHNLWSCHVAVSWRWPRGGQLAPAASWQSGFFWSWFKRNTILPPKSIDSHMKNKGEDKQRPGCHSAMALPKHSTNGLTTHGSATWSHRSPAPVITPGVTR